VTTPPSKKTLKVLASGKETTERGNGPCRRGLSNKTKKRKRGRAGNATSGPSGSGQNLGEGGGVVPASSGNSFRKTNLARVHDGGDKPGHDKRGKKPPDLNLNFHQKELGGCEQVTGERKPTLWERHGK